MTKSKLFKTMGIVIIAIDLILAVVTGASWKQTGINLLESFCGGTGVIICWVTYKWLQNRYHHKKAMKAAEFDDYPQHPGHESPYVFILTNVSRELEYIPISNKYIQEENYGAPRGTLIESALPHCSVRAMYAQMEVKTCLTDQIEFFTESLLHRAHPVSFKSYSAAKEGEYTKWILEDRTFHHEAYSSIDFKEPVILNKYSEFIFQMPPHSKMIVKIYPLKKQPFPKAPL